MKRIRRLLYRKEANDACTPLFAAAILIATAVVAFAAWPPGPPERNSAAAQRQKDRVETSPYHRWLNEEVVYIVTDEERTAFKNLTTDEEREKFVEQFWDRRNPRPGSRENIFKEEFYRRIAYANKHFASSRPGWKTDRGHMYILYGPPDEIESHAANPPHPYEEWMYRYIEGLGSNVIFRFVGRIGSGGYQLESPPWKSPAKKDSTSP